MSIYHSALKPELIVGKEIMSYKSGGNYVFVNDMTKSKPELHNIDVIYSEPSWQKGYSVFAERAGTKTGEFREYLSSIKEIIDLYNCPVFLTIGKHMTRTLKPEHVGEIKLNGGNALIGIWNHEKVEFSSNIDVIEYVTTKFNNILDFSCGYGNIVEYCIKKGKNFTCCDINAKCIYYIARAYMGMVDK
jgi:hypothetical protein